MQPLYINGRELSLHYRMDRGVWVCRFGEGWIVGTDERAVLDQVIQLASRPHAA